MDSVDTEARVEIVKLVSTRDIGVLEAVAVVLELLFEAASISPSS
jgi:hypothetical protein